MTKNKRALNTPQDNLEAEIKALRVGHGCLHNIIHIHQEDNTHQEDNLYKKMGWDGTSSAEYRTSQLLTLIQRLLFGQANLDLLLVGLNLLKGYNEESTNARRLKYYEDFLSYKNFKRVEDSLRKQEDKLIETLAKKIIITDKAKIKEIIATAPLKLELPMPSKAGKKIPDDFEIHSQESTKDDIIANLSEKVDDAPRQTFDKTKYVKIGVIHRNAKNYAKAIEDFTNAIKIDENFETAYYERGYTYLFRISQYDKAIEDFSGAIEVSNPSWNYLKWAYCYLAISHRYKKNYAQAIEDFTEAIKIDENFKTAYYERGYTYLYRTSDYDNAIKDFSRAIEVSNPSWTTLKWAYCYLAISHRYKKNYAQAIEDFTEAIRIDENFETAYYQRGYTYLYRTSQYDKAIEDFSRAIEVSNPSWNYLKWAYFHIGVSYQTLYKYKEAIAPFNQVIGIDKNFSDAYSRRGMCYDSLGEYDKAQEDHKKAESIEKGL